MGLFGRETERDAARIERTRLWLAARSPLALAAAACGLVAVVDSPVHVLSVPAAMAAIVLAALARRDLERHPGRKGHRLIIAAIVLAIVGLVATAFFIWVIYPSAG